MTLKSTSLQRLGATLLVIVIALLLGGVLLARGCSDPPPEPVKRGMCADSALVNVRPDSTRIGKPRKRKAPGRKRKEADKKPALLPDGSPLDYKM
ncbi:MAG: hypothetical protein K2J17_02305 [Paramuribaculum sp.]|nr:hypothetical protein [Paramuribaculum sp.]